MKKLKESPCIYIVQSLKSCGIAFVFAGVFFIMNSGIYKLEWKEQGYFYYGQSQNLKIRQEQHFTALKYQRHENSKLQRIFNKYGLPEFQLVEVCDLTELDVREQFYLDSFFKHSNCCNLSPTASSNRGTKRTAESKEKIRQSKLGTKQKPEQIENTRQHMLKRYASGWSPPRYSGNKNGFFGKKHDVATRLIMSEKKKVAVIGKNNPKARLILNVETGIYYDTIIEASQSTSHRTLASLRHALARKQFMPFIYA